MIDLPCPKCGAKLRAPDDAAGLWVRCKGCREKFRLPGVVADGPRDTQPLSVVPAAKPAVAVALADPIPLDDSFIEDAAPATRPPEPETKRETKRPKATPAEAKAALPAPSTDPFTFNAPGTIVVPSDPRRASGGSRGGRRKSSGMPFLVVGLLVGLMVAAGGGFAAYWFVLRQPEVAKAPTTLSTDTPPTDAKAEKAPAPAPKPNDGRGNRRAEPRQQTKADQGGKVANDAADKQVKGKGQAGKSRLPAPPGADAKVFAPAKETIPLAGAADTIRDLRVSTGKGDVASVFVLRKQFGGFQGAGATDVIERVTRSGGRPAGQFEVPADGVSARRPFDVTPDAQRAVVEGPAGKLTVYDFEEKKKLWDGVSVSADLPDRTAPVAAFFLTPDTLTVVDRSGAVDVWAVGEQKRREAGKAPSARGEVCAVRVAGKTVVAVGRQVFASAGASSGEPLAEFPATAEPVAITADILGKRAAVVYKVPNAGHTVAVLPLGGKQAPELVLAFADDWGWPEAIHWAEQDAISVTTRDRAAVSMSLEVSAAVAYLKGGGGVPFAGEYGVHFTALPKPGDPTATLLVGVELPLAGGQRLAAEAKESGGPIYLLPRADGIAR